MQLGNQLKEVDFTDSCTMDRLSEFHSAASSLRTSERNVEEQIERSKVHWSLLGEFNDDDDDEEEAEISNIKVFEALQMHPTFGTFFVTLNGGKDDLGLLEVGAKFAEGAQAELFHIHVTWGARRNVEETERERRNSIEERIKCSKHHWSIVAKPNPKPNRKGFIKFCGMVASCLERRGLAKQSNIEESGLAEQSNVEEFKSLHENDKWGSFFYTFDDGELVMGNMPFAEGGQAGIYEAKIKWRQSNWRELLLRKGQGNHVLEDPSEYVLKVFKKGTFLRDLKSNLPVAMLDFHAERVVAWMTRRHTCDVVCGTLLKDGRFAFVLQKEQGDLRCLIERNMKSRSEQDKGPFSKEVAENFIYEVALGMDWLHEHNIVHRDLKASNVLVREDIDWNYCFVADYECSVGTLGTGFHRAPEILQALKEKVNSKEREKLFTKKVDVYSYGMTCYEILTGKLPFEGYEKYMYDVVLNGKPLEVPEYVDDWMRDLLTRCWQFDHTARPSFQEILNILRENSAVIEAHLSTARNAKANWSHPKTEVFNTSEVIRLYKEKYQLSKSHSKKEKSEDEKKKESEAQIARRRQYQREDVLKSLRESEWVLKVFGKGTLLQLLQVQIPTGVLKFHAERMEPPKAGTTPEWKKPQHTCDVLCGVLLADGSFGFLLKREQQDLTSAIHRSLMVSSIGCAPFAKEVSKKMTHDIALGMNWLHSYDIIHRDLKAPNVLISADKDGKYECFVCDYECSFGVIGTGFYRAPEILQAMQDRTVSARPELFTKKVDIYSYGMTCYEILTGNLPFKDRRPHDFNDVINGLCPYVPDFVDEWAHDLLKRCWQSNPADRPSFQEILSLFEA